jgi:hypothetical protein
MNANLAVIADNLDYLLWGRLADGHSRRRGADAADGHRRRPLALPGALLLAASPGATAGWCGVCCSCGRKLFAASR